MRGTILIKKRLLAMLAVLTLLFCLVGVRIGSLTLFQGEMLTERGVKQWTREGIVSPRRGQIQDRTGSVLVLSAGAYAVTANPRLIADPAAFAKAVAPALETDAERIRARVENKAYASVILKRQASRETVDLLRQMLREQPALLQGLSFEEDSRRWYPKGAFLTQVLGLTNIDAQGQSGLESRYDTLLQGKAGSLRREVDARARLLPDGKTAYVPPENGGTVRLTVDAAIQGIVEKAMRECLEVNGAKAVQCIVMDVNTGAILALCMKPDYDPNDPPRDDVEKLQELMRITAVTDVYEPGSTFKMITCAAALDCGAAALSDTFNCSGSITVDGDRIRCWKNSHGHETLTQGLANSCNPVFVTLALRMGADTFYRYLRAFGLGVRTGIELPGESAGILIRADRVKNVDLARIGFGQSVAVTPLQLITAGCAVVNGGRLMRPYIVQEILDENGNVLERTQPRVAATPIHEETSAVMRRLLENVVENGGGRNGAVAGYRVAGKTGTAQVYKDGRVVSNVHIGSFLGFAPADQPRIAVLVTVNEAQVPVDYGSVTAAPFAAQILEEALPVLGVPRQDPKATQAPGVSVPDVVGMTVAEAKKALAEEMLLADTDGESPVVTAQSPAAGAQMRAGGTVMLYTFQGQPLEAVELVTVPDVRGLSMVEAGRRIRQRGLEMEVSGSGLAARQSPAAGGYAKPGDTVKVTFELPQGTE